MHRKLKSIYPEEEIVDGFSILCFENQRKLEKFSSSLNKNVQRTILNEINRPKDIASDDGLISTNTTNISVAPIIAELKNKSNITTTSPTRITAQRKSKPDMNTLTLAICCNKRRMQSVSPTKNVDLHVSSVEDDSKCADKENDYINGNNERQTVLANCQEIIKEIQRDSLQTINEYYASANKEEQQDFFVNAVNVTSTISPLSPQLVNDFQTELESMDLADNNEVSDCKDIDKTLNCLDVNNNDKQSPMVDNNKSVDSIIEDDDCIITSISFDENPKMMGITLSSVEHLLIDFPKLEPAPPILSVPSIKTILLENYQKSQAPPPLIPAPAYYFLTNVKMYPSNNGINQTVKSVMKCVAHKSIVSPKLKSPRRNMKSSILKLSNKSSSKSCSTSTTTSMRAREPHSIHVTDKTHNPVVRSLLQNTKPATKLYSINTLKNATLTPLTTINHYKAAVTSQTSVAAIANSNISTDKASSKLISNPKIQAKKDNIPKCELVAKRHFVKYPISRKTQNHIDIAHWISKKISTKINVDRSHSINIPTTILKPQSRKALYRPFIPLDQLNPINTSQSSFNFAQYSAHKYPSHKFISPNTNLFKPLVEAPQLLIRSLNSVTTTFPTTNTVFLNSSLPNFCARSNLLLLR